MMEGSVQVAASVGTDFSTASPGPLRKGRVSRASAHRKKLSLFPWKEMALDGPGRTRDKREDCRTVFMKKASKEGRRKPRSSMSELIALDG